MKAMLSSSALPDGCLLFACSSHEERCEGLCRVMGAWRPRSVVLFHYDDVNPKREERHGTLVAHFRALNCELATLQFAEQDAARSLHQNIATMDAECRKSGDAPVVLDSSVFTKRHLLMILRWLDDRGLWDRLFIVYSEPGEYVVSRHIPLSFGIARIHQIPGLCAAPDISRPLHLVIFLGYEGDRALAAYEQTQPMETTLIIPHPPYRPEWEGRTENFNRDLIGLVGKEGVLRVDGIDPAPTTEALSRCLGEPGKMSSHSKVICPLGTKPQAVGIYAYLRDCVDPPAVVYASPLRHNHSFFSEGIGKTWLLKSRAT